MIELHFCILKSRKMIFFGRISQENPEASIILWIFLFGLFFFSHEMQIYLVKFG